MSHHTLDARHILCPLPVIRTQDAIKELHSGECLEVVCTDPGAMADIPTWCRINGHTVLEAKTENNEILIRIQVGDPK